MPVFDSQVAEPGKLVKLLEVLREVDTSAPGAKINEESIDDNNGGRIIL